MELSCLVVKSLNKMETNRIIWLDEYLAKALEIAWQEGYERAVEMLKHLLYEEPGYGRLHNTLGIIYYKYADEPVLAEMHFRWAIHFSPDLSEPYALLADLLKTDERHDETIAICKKGLRVKRTNKSLLHESAGNAWELKGKYRRAIMAYKKALNHSTELWICRVLEENISRCKRKAA
jgi:tetratricopeptide (TPR) repeat protein